MNVPVTTTRLGGVAIVTMSNPPHNLLNESVKAELLVAMTALRHDEDVTAVVLTGAGTRFSAGVDLRATAEGERPLADIADLIEAMDKPVVAALHGTVLGGGLELAMACHWRLAAPGVRLGLPGAVVGRLPMAGGSQRLTRLVGPRRTLDMLLTSALLEAEEALALGLIDAVAPGDPGGECNRPCTGGGDPQAAAAAHQPAADTTCRRSSPTCFSQLRAQVARGAPGLFALPRCVDAVDAACMLPTGHRGDGAADQPGRHLPQPPAEPPRWRTSSSRNARRPGCRRGRTSRSAPSCCWVTPPSASANALPRRR